MKGYKFFKLTYEPIESSGEIKLVHTQKVLEEWGKDWVRRSRQNLTRLDKNASKALYKSLDYTLKVKNNNIIIGLEALGYADFVEYGVQGAGPYTPPKNPSGKSTKPYINRAPGSPFKFGSKTGEKGGLTTGIRSWVQDRKVRFKDTLGRYMSYDAMTPIISRNVYRYGIEPTDFAYSVMPRLVKKYKARFQLALAKDIANHMGKEVFPKPLIFEIVI